MPTFEAVVDFPKPDTIINCSIYSMRRDRRSDCPIISNHQPFSKIKQLVEDTWKTFQEKVKKAEVQFKDHVMVLSVTTTLGTTISEGTGSVQPLSKEYRIKYMEDDKRRFILELPDGKWI